MQARNCWATKSIANVRTEADNERQWRINDNYLKSNELSTLQEKCMYISIFGQLSVQNIIVILGVTNCRTISGRCLAVVNLTLSFIHHNFTQVLQIANDSVLNVTAVSIDSFAANSKFYQELCAGKLKSSIENPVNKQQPFYLLSEAVYKFNYIYNNFL